MLVKNLQLDLNLFGNHRNYHLKPVQKRSKPHTKDSNHFLEKMKKLRKAPSNDIIVTADMLGLHNNITHDSGVKKLYEKLQKREVKIILLTDLVNMDEFVLKINYFRLDSKVKRKISSTPIRTKFVPL